VSSRRHHVGLRDRIKREKVKGQLRAELVKANGERILAVTIKNDPDGGLLIHRAIEQAAQ
jgi:hypothetical protein